ncbi:MAG: RpoL/Rpb11 RNA polymerase subunit family protein [Candidatus Thermoplasmatota archaeon]|jgi:DNA-directed RNA polymerase subunit L|nr:RpoL/Rpb11 RNA polymerase subunit family protein [Candidatus Thermoplasmatota archaeon]MEC7254163.1 RpoL/Rpb11 RNA polymerase subunit family protein [Candidatus Thermoplasmatota archaeon]
MPVKVLIHEKNELRLRITGESHTALQILRDRLNNHSSVEYANYFPGHPDLDPPEFYIRTTGKAKPDAILNEIVDSLSNDFESLTL